MPSEIQTDEYGDLFEDYGCLARADAKRQEGNYAFKKERYQQALSEYERALDEILTLSYDKSITIGKQKFNDVVVLRSTIYLNRSACYFKLEDWKKALDEAMLCLVGTYRDELMFTDPLLRAKVLEATRQRGPREDDVAFLEQRLPKLTRAKAWFRISQCYCHQGYLDRAKEALAKAIEAGASELLPASDITAQSLRIDGLEKAAKEKQAKQFKGFFEKLQSQGGYAEPKLRPVWGSDEYREKYRAVAAEAEEDELARIAAAYGTIPGTDPQAEVRLSAEALERLRHRGSSGDRRLWPEEVQLPGFRLSREAGPPNAATPPPVPATPPPVRPSRQDELPLRWAVDSKAKDRGQQPAQTSVERVYYEDEYDEDEEMALEKARIRINTQRWQRKTQQKRAQLEALDDSD